MGDTVERDVVREANNTLVERADELWHFGPVSDGALSEILRARQKNKKVRCFSIVVSKGIVETSFKDVELEDEIKDKRELLCSS